MGARAEHYHRCKPADDYNFKKRNQVMQADRLGDAVYAEGKIESFDYPGDYPDQNIGKIVAGLRTEQERGADWRNPAAGDCVSLGAGMRVKLSGDPVPGTGETYLCLAASHNFVTEPYGSGTESDGYAFTGSYVLMPDTAPMAPPKRTPLAVVQGPQTAMVVGEGEIDCDDYGRILVRFHWDLEGAHSMRCRVSQNWAGAGWGGMVIPRIGMEIVVEFLEGDPDKPLVVGCVYNGRSTPPLDLPSERTRSTFKTNSVGAEGFNELTFEDLAGEEIVYLHAQKNMETKVENSALRRVEFDDTLSIGNNLRMMVAADRIETVDGAMDLTVHGALAERTDGNRSLSVGGDMALRADGDLSLKTKGEIVLDADRITLVVGGSALVLDGSALNVTPLLNVGAASPGAVALPALPAVLQAAAGEGIAFVAHCPAGN